MGLAKLRAQVRAAERDLVHHRHQTGEFVEQTSQQVRRWFGPWSLVGAGSIVGAWLGWGRGSGSNDAFSEEDRSTEGSAAAPRRTAGIQFSQAIAQATQVIQLMTLAAPLIAQLTAVGDHGDAAPERAESHSPGGAAGY
ncbi:MAG: hypothetical protein KDI71_11525 [Xanthomonadales bacterium]|nr:hypothetical protein [Xanthomonadales bacterium]